MALQRADADVVHVSGSSTSSGRERVEAEIEVARSFW